MIDDRVDDTDIDYDAEREVEASPTRPDLDDPEAVVDAEEPPEERYLDSERPVDVEPTDLA